MQLPSKCRHLPQLQSEQLPLFLRAQLRQQRPRSFQYRSFVVVVYCISVFLNFLAGYESALRTWYRQWSQQFKPTLNFSWRRQLENKEWPWFNLSHCHKYLFIIRIVVIYLTDSQKRLIVSGLAYRIVYTVLNNYTNNLAQDKQVGINEELARIHCDAGGVK